MENVAKIPVDISITNGQVKAIYDAREMPSLELSLKRQIDIEEDEPGAQERNVLRRSNLSAFSRYNTNSTANQASAGNVGSCSPVDNSSENAKTETIHNLQSNSNGIPNQGSNGTSNNNDMGSTTNNAYTRPPTSGEKPMLESAVNIRPCSAFQPVKDGYVSSRQSLLPDKINFATMNTVLAQAKGMPSHVQRSHNHQHYLHRHYHIHDMQQQRQKLPDLNELSGMTLVAAAPQSGPVSFSSSKTENGSASGSSNGSNGQNGSSSAIREGTNRGSDNGVAEKRGTGGDGASGSGGGVDQNRSARREAALKKFREKRKERCFKKKVRYQSRKTLAEQRPRVRGQFARQSHVR